MGKNFKSWPSGFPKTLNYPEIPVYAFLDQTAARVPNRIAIIFQGMELTFNELKTSSERFAAALADMGVQKGDRVAIHLPNCPQFAIAYYGILRVGGVFTPLSPLLTPREATYQLQDSGAETLISSDILFPEIQSIIPETNVRRIITTSFSDCFNNTIATFKPIKKAEIPGTSDMVALIRRHKPHFPNIRLEVKEDLAHLAYTGGTTGLSKGVMITHQNVITNALQHLCWFNGVRFQMVDGAYTFVKTSESESDRDKQLSWDRETALICVPWFHAAGTVNFLNNQICMGNTMVVYPRFDPKEYLEGVGKYGATIVGGAPQLYIPLINRPDFESYDLSGIKLATSGAAPLAVSVLEKLLEAFSGNVIEGYGLTECTMGAMANPPDRSSIRPGSVGMPVFDTECKVVDPLSGEDLPPGSEGEICIRGPQIMKGYWNKPDETEKVIKDGWLYTGDIGLEDEDGYFYITDRKKDLIIYKGYNVYPREIEEVMIRHPAVQQCTVVGKHDLAAGEIPVAFVEVKKGAQATREEILDYTNSRIARYKKVRDLIFVETIPVSAAGKVLKRELKKCFAKE